MEPTFQQRVLSVVQKIKKGHTLTYGQVAALAGSPKAARAVGTIVAKNFDSAIPCHRVVRSDGDAGQYNRGRETKIKLLREEGCSGF